MDGRKRRKGGVSMEESQGKGEHMATIAVEEGVGGNLEEAGWSFYLIKKWVSSFLVWRC